MSQTRNTIELLCKILRENGTTKIKAEIFRLAKFNQDDVAPVLWKLLFELLYYCEYGKIDGVSDRACNQLTDDELVVYTKRQMQRRGFHSPEFAGLARDMSGGSRELLLGLGWLVCKENIIQRFMHACTSPLEEDTFNNQQVSLEGFEPPKLSQDVVDRVQQLLWFNNKLRLNLRTLYAIQREKNLLKHKIHEATYGVTTDPERNHLTMFEVHLLRHPDLLKKNLQLLEQDNERLQNLLKWREHEDVFWKWMESVLDEKLKESGDISDPSQHDTNVNLNRQEVTSQSVALTQECHDELQEAIMNYEAIVDHLERLWDSKKLTVSEEELDRLLFSIDSELSIQKANLALSQTDRKTDKQTRFVYQKPDVRPVAAQNQPPGGAVNTMSGAGQLVSIQREIDSLYTLVETLQQEIDTKQDSFREEMQELNSRFTEAVCIPPMGRREYGGVSTTRI